MARKKGLDLARAIGALGIIAFHFYCHSHSNYKLFLNHANGSWGGTLNFLFFAVSGYLLQMRYGANKTLKVRAFYYKRWKSTIPAYLLVFAYVVLMNIFTHGQVFYMPIPKTRMLLALTGIDSYLNWIMPTYSTVGEWFLGAILITYMLYPLLWHLHRMGKYFLLVGLLAICLYFIKEEFFGFPYSKIPFVFLLCVYIGMLLAEHSCGGRLCAFSFIVCLVLFLIPIGHLRTAEEAGLRTFVEMLSGICLLIVLMEWGERLCANAVIYQCVSFVSSLSYYTFLLHHSIIYKVLDGFNPFSTARSGILLCIIFVMTLIFSKILDIVMKAILESKTFLKWEMIIMKDIF